MNKPQEDSLSLIPILAGVSVSIIFGFSFLFSRTALERITPFQLLGFRFLTAAILLQILKTLRIIRINLKGKNISSLLVLSLVQPGMYFIFEAYGLKFATSSEAGIMISLIPIVVTIFAYFFLDEKANWKQWLFILSSVAGVSLIVLMKSTASISGNILGLLLLLGAVTAGGFYNIQSRKSSLNFKPIEITYIMMWFGTILFNSLALIEQSLKGDVVNYFKPLLSLPTLISILYLGTLSSVVAFFFVNFMLSKIAASRSSVFGNLTTVVSIIAGVFIKNEPFHWYHIAGSAMILLGIWGTNYFAERKRRNIALEQHEF